MMKQRILLMGLCLFVGIARPVSANDSALFMDDLIVTVIDEVEVPAMETGAIVEILVREGNAVKKGDVLARLDDRRAQLAQSLAMTQLEIANAKAGNPVAVALAEKAVSREKQLNNEQATRIEMAKRKSENDLRVRAASKSEEVAKTELDRAIEAKKRYVDSISHSEIDSINLIYQKAKIETQQAKFEQALDALQLTLEERSAETQQLAVEQAKLEVEQSANAQHLEQLQLKLQQHQTKLAELMVLQHSVIAPFDASVVEIKKRSGQWVRSGEGIIRLVRLNRLRAEGYVDASLRNRLQKIESPTLSLKASGGEVVQRIGDIVYISPEIDPVNSQVRIWIEFENPSEEVLPGMRMVLKVKE